MVHGMTYCRLEPYWDIPEDPDPRITKLNPSELNEKRAPESIPALGPGGMAGSWVRFGNIGVSKDSGARLTCTWSK